LKIVIPFPTGEALSKSGAEVAVRKIGRDDEYFYTEREANRPTLVPGVYTPVDVG
jgi:hypothetical protein